MVKNSFDNNELFLNDLIHLDAKIHQSIQIHVDGYLFTCVQYFSDVKKIEHISQMNVFFFLKLRRAIPDRNCCSRFNSPLFEYISRIILFKTS
jgi:hypothetical protein